MNNDKFKLVSEFKGCFSLEITEETDIAIYEKIKKSMEKIHDSKSHIEMIDAWDCVGHFYKTNDYKNWYSNVQKSGHLRNYIMNVKPYAVHWENSSNEMIQSRHNEFDMSLIFANRRAMVK